MSQPADPFEARLEALFADPVEAPDAESFAQKAERRILGEQKRRGLVFAICTGVSALLGGAVVALTGWKDSSAALENLEQTLERMGPAWVQETVPLVMTALLVLFIVDQFAASKSRF